MLYCRICKKSKFLYFFVEKSECRKIPCRKSYVVEFGIIQHLLKIDNKIRQDLIRHHLHIICRIMYKNSVEVALCLFLLYNVIKSNIL